MSLVIEKSGHLKLRVVENIGLIQGEEVTSKSFPTTFKEVSQVPTVLVGSIPESDDILNDCSTKDSKKGVVLSLGKVFSKTKMKKESEGWIDLGTLRTATTATIAEDLNSSGTYGFELEDESSTPSAYFDAATSPSISLLPTPTSPTHPPTSTLISTSPPNAVLSSPSDYFSRPPRSNAPQRSSPLPIIPASPLPFVTDSPLDYTSLMVPPRSSSPSTYSSSYESENEFYSPSTSEIYYSPPIFDTVETDHNQSERRYHALVELVETETGYLESLKLLVNVYFQSLPCLTVLSNRDIELIYRNSQKLLELHQRIVSRLILVEEDLQWKRTKEIRKNNNLLQLQEGKICEAAERVATIFLDEFDNFALYNDFCARHGDALDLIRSLEATPDWVNYENQCSDLISSFPISTLKHPDSSSSTTSSTITINHPSLPSSTPSRRTSTSTPSTPPSPINRPSLAHRSESKLRVQDYLIAPIQRICRYPLLFSQILKHLGEDIASEKVQVVRQAFEAMSSTARNVDEAKTSREIESRTKTVAMRMEFQSAVNLAFKEVLGSVLLIHALHVLHRSQLTTEPMKIKYFGVFLYATHLVMVKVKKRDVYEPREWLPLRLFEVIDIKEGEGIMPFSFRLSYRDHQFELGASCAAEKKIWLTRIMDSKTQSHQLWDQQPIDKHGRQTLFDDTVVSSVSPLPASNSLPISKAHGRSKSLGAVVIKSSSYEENSPIESFSPVVNTLTLSSKNRFSTTASSILLGRTPATQRAAIDLRLADIASSECVTARAQAAREDTSSRGTSGGRSKNSKTARRRLSLVDGIKNVEASNISEMGLLLNFTPAPSGIEDWDLTVKRNISSRRESLEIDTSSGTLFKDLNRTRSMTWRSRTMSLRAKSKENASSSGSSKERSTSNDIERNNSTSSSTSSSGTGNFSIARSSTTTQATSRGSPSNSVPGSPICSPIEFDPLPALELLPEADLLVRKASRLSRMSTTSRSSFAPSLPAKDGIDDTIIPPSPTSTCSSGSRPDLRRGSLTMGNFFSKRIQSAPNLFRPNQPESSTQLLTASLVDLPSPSLTASSRNLSTPSSPVHTSFNALNERPSLSTTGGKGPTRSKSIRFFFTNKFTPL